MQSDRRDQLKSIRTFPSLVRYLRDELDWPIGSEDFEDMFFDFTPEELGIDTANAAKIQEIKRLRPLSANQPWGIFFVKFEPKRLPVVALRRILAKLVIRKRASANRSDRPAWNLHDLLFISNYGDGDQREITFAHFKENGFSGDLPTLKVLGWDGADAALHLDHVHQTLTDKLRWPDDGDDLDTWRETWSSAFAIRHREVITTSRDLAIELADLARDIRKRANTILAVENEAGPLRKLMAGFKEALIHDLSEDDFADMYAQTIAYGLLSARVSRPAGLIAENLADMVPITSPFLKEMMETFIVVGGRKWDASEGRLVGIDFDELGVNDVVELLREANMEAVLRDFGKLKPQEDPVIHFYEHFLAAYDKRKKISRGVFYTPKPVVSFIVRSVDELLRTEFGLVDGLADTTTWGKMVGRHEGFEIPEGTRPEDPFVQILDPATGTGTFLVEVIDLIHRTMTEKWQAEGHDGKKIDQLWNDYVPKHLLPCLHGYELLMAPYAIAHMKIGLKLYETGYRFGSDKRARIYLTNTLEPAHDFSGTFAFAIPALAHEAQAVNEVKRKQQFTVIIGNPPYANYGQLNKNHFILGLLDDYKRNLNEKKLNLDDDFIKFVRYSQYLIDDSGAGALGMITNNSFTDGITHRRMRDSLISSFDYMYILNLHGSTKKKEKTPDGSKDENVFDIQQGVAISIGLRLPGRRASLLRAKDLWGDRTSKYMALATTNVLSKGWVSSDAAPPYFFFTDKNLDAGAEYENWESLKSVFVVSGNGVKTERDSVSIHFTREGIERTVWDFRNLDEATLRSKCLLGKDSRDWAIPKAKADVLNNRDESLYRRILYPPFDFRHTWYSGQSRGFIGTPAIGTMRHMHDGNLALVATRQTIEQFDVLCADVLVGHKSVAAYDINTAFPLFLDEAEGAISFESNGGSERGEPCSSRQTNFAPRFLDLLAEHLGIAQTGKGGLPQGISPEDIFHYAYAVFHSPGYRSRYGEFLKIDFPRLPLTGNQKLFRALAHLGGELVTLHLMEAPRLGHFITSYTGPKNPEVGRVGWSDKTVWLDAGKTNAREGHRASRPGAIGFKGVPEAIWVSHIGGYQVCHKWLKDRKGRTLSNEDIAHYQKIVVALNETIHLMQEIDEVIDQHGGWPGAFQVEASTS